MLIKKLESCHFVVVVYYLPHVLAVCKFQRVILGAKEKKALMVGDSMPMRSHISQLFKSILAVSALRESVCCECV